MGKEPRLGRGLDALLSETASKNEGQSSAGGVGEIPVGKIKPNPFQPRKDFEGEAMDDLVESVRRSGILQPLLLRQRGKGGYELIAGERRLRAAQIAGFKTVPATVRDVPDDEMLTLALVENLQRNDLNPIEKGVAFSEMMKRFHITQDEVASRVGKSRSAIANFVRLLDLPESIQRIVSRGTISMGHAKALLGISFPAQQQAVALRIVKEGLSVRDVEGIASRKSRIKYKRPVSEEPDAHMKDVQNRLRERLGTKVALYEKDGRGKVVISFFSNQDLQRIMDVLGA